MLVGVVGLPRPVQVGSGADGRLGVNPFEAGSGAGYATGKTWP